MNHITIQINVGQHSDEPYVANVSVGYRQMQSGIKETTQDLETPFCELQIGSFRLKGFLS